MTQSTITAIEGSSTVFGGAPAVRVYQATVIASALKLYANTKMMVNRAYTPKKMLETATSITGKTYKRGQYMIAHDDLKTWADAQIGATVNVK